MVLFGWKKLTLIQPTTKHLQGCCLKRGAVTEIISLIYRIRTTCIMYSTIRTSAKPKIHRIYNKIWHCYFKTWVTTLMSLLHISTEYSVFIDRSPGIGQKHRLVHTLIRNRIYKWIHLCIGKSTADSTKERRCYSIVALLIPWRRFRLISSLPFNFCSLFLSSHNFTPNSPFGW